MIRTRFAPSPTGELHIGVARTALFAWLIAKQADGTFILRIEDTDKGREVEGALERIQDDLAWLGLDWNEGPGRGGEFGPYIQSERLETYRAWAQKLIEKDLAYADPYSEEELQAFREKAKAEKRPFHFRDHRPTNPPVWDGSQPLRFRIDADKSPDWHDEVRGDQAGSTENIDDFIIIKADGYPTYNFAHIVDDAEMQVTHIVRSDEFLSSMPKFLLLYEALGLIPPKFVHVAPILNRGGGKKLSKRDGAASVAEFREEGYLPEALINYMALLGWNDGDTKEIFDINELLERFAITKLHKSGGQFDIDRLRWVNAQHLRTHSDDSLEILLENFWPSTATDAAPEYKHEILNLIKERLQYGGELSDLSSFFFEDPKISLDELSSNTDQETTREYLLATREALSDIKFERETIETTLRATIEKLKTKPGVLLPLIRMATTGTHASPPLFDTLTLLGKEATLRRLNNPL